VEVVIDEVRSKAAMVMDGKEKERIFICEIRGGGLLVLSRED
jgi:hypothetical protein